MRRAGGGAQPPVCKRNNLLCRLQVPAHQMRAYQSSSRCSEHAPIIGSNSYRTYLHSKASERALPPADLRFRLMLLFQD